MNNETKIYTSLQDTKPFKNALAILRMFEARKLYVGNRLFDSNDGMRSRFVF